MKDAPFKQSPNSGQKLLTKKKLKTIQKVKKNNPKLPKEPKTKAKVLHNPKSKKPEKKLPKNIKAVKSKKPDKKLPSVKKKIEPKKKLVSKKNAKEQKNGLKKTGKIIKKEAEVKPCRKRKLTEKTCKKNTWGPPTKMPKTSFENPTLINKLENGISNVVPQTTRSSSVLKLGVASTPNSTGCSKDIVTLKKSVSCVPKKGAIPSTFVKNNLLTFNEAVCKENGETPKLVNGDEPPKTTKSKVAKAKKELPSKKVKEVSKCIASGAQVNSAKKNKIMTLPPAKSSVSSHPQRMARLDALAKMHVICTTDRRTTSEPAKSESVINSQHPTTAAECKGTALFCEGSRAKSDISKHKFHSRINISVAEKQWNFVSRSVQEESCVNHRQNQSVYPALSPQEQTSILKKKRGRPKTDSIVEQPTVKKSKSDPDICKGKKILNPGKQKVEKISKNTETVNNKVIKRTCRKDPCRKALSKSSNAEEKRTKLKETKTQHVKVQETIRMKKTCTYQSVTVNNHCESNSDNLPQSHVHTPASSCTNIKKLNHVSQASENQNDSIDSELLPPRSPSMGVHCYAANVPSVEKPVSPASQPVGMEAPDCCGYHSPPLIPLAHAQSCHLGHRMALETHFDGGFPVHRFQQQHLMYSHPSHGDYSCCCSSCLVHTPYSHLPTHSHLLHSGHAFSSDGLCTGCHHHSPCSAGDSVDSVKRQYTYASGCTSHLGAWCSCYDVNSSRHGSCLCQKASSACMAADYPHQALVPCDQTPLDLSRASSSSSSSVQVSEAPLRPQCSSPLCHTDHMLFKSSRECSGGSQSKAGKPCCRDGLQACARKLCREEQASPDLPLDMKQNPQQLLQLTTNKEHKTVHIIRLRHHHHHHQMTETKTSQAHVMGQGSTLVSVTEGSTSTSYVRQVAGCQDFSTCIKDSCSKGLESHHTQSVQSLPCSPKVSPKTEVYVRQNQNRIFPVKKLVKRKFAHGWSWEGEPTDRLIALTNDSVPYLKKCYPAMRHKEGDIIKERDCVLLRSGSKDTDLPFVAKVAAFWENPEDGEMMMSLLWYYRPEHTEQGRKPGQMEDEVFASKHKDVNSVACIEDKCYVLTFAEYCRYRARLFLPENGVLTHSLVVPDSENGYPRSSRLPPDCTSPEMVFFCRNVYDFRQKRILKNPM